ncbi:hypothetical protein ACFWF9_01745 [Streptomyces roseolus]|uniref:hypothetical protein n=1 Tax=Streptomyces roseolus TaxID=67358 RepID=UPI00366635BC
MPVGERVAGVGEVAAEDAEVLVGEVAQPPGGVRVGRLAEPVMEVGGGNQHLTQSGHDAVVSGGQLGQSIGHFVGRGGSRILWAR